MRRLDPRVYQIATLSGLLAYGLLRLDFGVTPAQAATSLGAALATQLACGRLAGRGFEAKSALISGLSLCLLLRANVLAVAALGSLLAIASKFVIRWRGKHVFNPTNFGLVAAILLTGEAWVSPGQWGTSAFFAFLTACLGGLVVHRALRSDVTLVFLSAYSALLFGRALRLGDPPSLPLHQLESGALLIFSFFMISDPRTTPDSRAGRVLFGVLVAAGAAFVQFGLFRPNGPLWSLAACAPLVPLIDRVLPGRRYEWGGVTPVSGRTAKGVPHATLVDLGRPVAGRGAAG